MKWWRIGLFLILFNIWLTLMVVVDHIMHSDLYSYNLVFSYAWADPYWAAITLLFLVVWGIVILGSTKSRRSVAMIVTMLGEWLAFDTFFYLFHGSFPTNDVIWFWTGWYRFLNVQWATPHQHVYFTIIMTCIIITWAYVFYKER